MPPKFTDKMYDWIRYACNVMMAIQVVLVCYIVFARFILNASPPWGEEVALLLMVWFCLLSPPEAIRDNRHLNITLCQNFLPGPVIKVIDILNHVLVFAFAAFMVIEGTKLSILTSRNILPGMGLPATVLYVSIPAAGVLLAFSAIERIVIIGNIPAREYREKGCKD